MLNCSAAIVRPKKPFIDWASNLDDSNLTPSSEDEKTVYLLPEYYDDLEAQEMLSKSYDIIFEAELEGWCVLEDTWPKNRSFKKFREWFEVELHSLVDDLCGYAIEDDENT